MKRRHFFKVAGSGAIATAVASIPLMAQAETGSDSVQIDTSIGNNHGHELTLTIGQVVDLIGDTNEGGSVEIDIQGQSGHPHGVVFDQPLLIELLAKKQLILDSTVIAGHAHEAVIEVVI